MTIGPDNPAQAALYKDVSPGIVNSVKAASRRTGVDFAYLMAKAAVESDFDADAEAKDSSARGLYQFTSGTWLDMVKAHGAEYGLGQEAEALKAGTLGDAAKARLLEKRDDPRLSAAMAGEYARSNADRLQAALGRKPGPTELYLAHFLGAGGAVTFLKGLDDNAAAPAAPSLPAAAAANEAVFYRNGRPQSYRAIYDRFSEKLASAGVAAGTATAATDVTAPPSTPSVTRPSGSHYASFRKWSPPADTRPDPGMTFLTQDAVLLLASHNGEDRDDRHRV